MNIHRKIIAIVAVGMALFLVIVVLSLYSLMASFSSVMTEVESMTAEIHRIQDIATEMRNMTSAVERYAASRDTRDRVAYHAARAAAHRKIDNFTFSDAGRVDRELLIALKLDLKSLEDKADRILILNNTTNGDRAQSLLNEMADVLARRTKDIDEHFRNERAEQTGMLADNFYVLKNRIVLLFLLILVTAIGFLFAFGLYLHRRVAVPLNHLWKGSTEISRGNLDYQMQLKGTSDIGRLAEQFNDMAQKLKSSYGELEKKLLERTNELAAIDAVALTLGQSGNLRDMLSRSLDKILDSLAGLEPRGGVFLCEAGGDTLRLVAHKGLSPEFSRMEETIAMGECLCGMVAQTGEILYAEHGCADPRHTRCRDSADHSHIIIPIKSRGIVLGVVFLYPEREFILKPSDLQMLETIGTQLGMAVENLRFYAEVKESSEKFWDLFENALDILITTDTGGTLTAANKTAERFTGYSKSELVGKNVLDFLTAEGSETAQRLLRGEGGKARRVTEFEVIRRDNSRAYLEVSARRLFKQKEPAGYQISARDVTEQKVLREKVLKAERVGAIGEIVITVRHEINNPLTTVIGNVELLIERYGDRDKELAGRLETILNNALRIAEIVKQLKAIKRDKVVEYVRGVSMTDLKQE